MWVRDAELAEPAGEWRRRWRRRLGPVAWVVLEELCDHVDGGGEAHVSARSLAAVLGLDKDTVARALRRLSSAGLVAGGQRREGGRFGAGSYRLLVPESGRAGSSTPMTTQPPRARRKSPARSGGGRARPAGQQSLFDPDDLTSGPHQRPESNWSSSDLA